MNQGYAGGREPADDEPITVEDPTTGFHPDQLTAYPLQRVGTRLYVAHIEAVAATELPHDTVLVDSNQMDAYAFGDLGPDAFDEAPIRYSALDAPTRQNIPEAPYRGSGELVIEDFTTYETPDGETLGETDVVSVLMTDPGDDHGLSDVRRKLDKGRLSVEVVPDRERAMA